MPFIRQIRDRIHSRHKSPRNFLISNPSYKSFIRNKSFRERISINNTNANYEKDRFENIFTERKILVSAVHAQIGSYLKNQTLPNES